MITRITTGLLALLLSVGLQAQYTLTVNGSLPNCVPNTIVQISDSLSGLYTIAEMDWSCTFSATFDAFAPSGILLVQGLCSNGTVASVSVSYQFDQPGDTLAITVALVCGPDPIDCLGVTNGSAVPGSDCDDGDPDTNFDMWGADCICMGFDSTAVLDCLGQPNGGNLPGTPCFDPNNPVFPLGIWNTACACEPDSSFLIPDCLGILGGPNQPGGSCDDGDASTEIDLWDSNCVCVGLDSSQVVFDCLGIANGSNLPGTPCIDNNSPYLIGTWSAACACEADSTFAFFDCLGIQNGPNMPGSACDDGNQFTAFDAWDVNCICAGQDTTGTLDCLGIPNGPNLPGQPCTILPDSSNTVVGNWGPDCVCYAIMFDCTGLPGGPNMPGAVCDDGDPSTFNDVWSANCVCAGIDTTFTLDCAGIPSGPDLPGTLCFDLNDPSLFGVWTVDCVCAVDSTWYPTDCLGIPGGPDQPGAPCNDGDPATTFDFWSTNCQCIGLDSTQVVFDCLGQPNGGNLPGTPCFNGNDPFLLGIWTPDCICGPDSSWMVLDCLGVLGGQAAPGQPCDDGDPATDAYWTVDCQCAVPVPQPCTAGFVVLPMNVDTTSNEPIMLFIFNTSFGGDGNYSFLWEFGDGATSTDPWPVHAYAGNGPYVMCLTLTDGSGCSNTFCDTLSLDEFGIFGMMADDGRSSGFMVAVQSGAAPTSVDESPGLNELSAWPNPVADQLTIQLNSNMVGAADVMVLDMNGRMMDRRSWALGRGNNQFILPTMGLAPGAYIVRISAASGTVQQRIVRMP